MPSSPLKSKKLDDLVAKFASEVGGKRNFSMSVSQETSTAATTTSHKLTYMDVCREFQLHVDGPTTEAQIERLVALEAVGMCQRALQIHPAAGVDRDAQLPGRRRV